MEDSRSQARISCACDFWTSLVQENMESTPDSSQDDSRAMEESPHEGLKAHCGPSQEDLGATEKPPQADLRTCSGPDMKALGALSGVLEEGLKAWTEEPKANLMSCPIDLEQAKVPLQDCLGLLPEEKPWPSLIESVPSARLSQETKVCLSLKTEDQSLLPVESVERAQTGSSVKHETEGSQTGPSQASFPLGEPQKLSQNSEKQTMPLTPHKLEEPQTGTFQIKQNSKRKRFKKKMQITSRIYHETSQNCQLQRPATNNQTESPQPVFQDTAIEQRSSKPRVGWRVSKNHLRLYSRILCPMNKGVMLKIMSYRESGLLKEGKCLYVCDKFLMGKCQDGLDCPAYHTLFPFHWQFLSREDNSWHSVSCGTQLHLEMLYANPNNSTVSVSESRGFISFLDMFSQSFSKYSCYSFCRRLSCQEDSFFAPWYILYWFNGQVWTLFNQDGAHSLGLERMVTMHRWREMLPDLENSLKPKGERKPPVCYRPRYIPLHLLVHNLRIWNLEKPKDLSIWGEDALDLCLDNYPELKMKMKIPRNQHFILMEILPSESTYQYCCKLFYFSMNPLQSVVLRIFRLYNPELWEQYKRQKAKMTVHKTVSTSLEYHLFHETTISLEHLAANGLDSKLSRYDGILGYGTYFSLHAKTASLMNSVYDPDFGHVMVLARVLVGENTVGRPGLQAPPFKPDGQQFDSCVNSTDMPTLFVVFKEEYSFPHFIILYKHFRDSVHLVF